MADLSVFVPFTDLTFVSPARQAGYVAPRVSISNAADRGWSNIELVGKDSIWKLRLKNLSDILSTQFRSMRFFPFGMSSASFEKHVMHVCKMVASEQMIWVDTSAIIAAMANIFVGFKRPIESFERKSIDGISLSSPRSRSTIGWPVSEFTVQPTSIFISYDALKDVASGGAYSVTRTDPLISRSAYLAVGELVSTFSHTSDYTMAEIRKSRKR